MSNTLRGIVANVPASGPAGASQATAATLYNPRTGRMEALRTPTKLVYANNVAVGQALTTLYTAPAGIRYRVLGAVVTTSVPGTAANQFNFVNKSDQQTFATWAPAAANVSALVTLPGNGYLAPLAGDSIQVNGPAGVLTYILYICEERDDE